MKPAASMMRRITARDVVMVQARKVTSMVCMFWKMKISARIPKAIPRINLITFALL
jgi:hypothetical protein